ncbi:ribonuclease H-like domain-containing protein, partial [Tanacetum coccineum]
MTRNIAYLSDFKEFDEVYITFGGGAYGGRITDKGTLKTNSLDFKDVYFVNDLKFNLFSVSQMCDKKNYVLFTDTECLVLSPNFMLPDESQILLKILREDNMYSFDIKNIVPKRSLTCLDETSEILKNFIKEIENLVDKKVKIIRCDNGKEFKNKVMDDFYREKGIRREYNVARTLQQNGVAERRNKTLIEAARTILADSKSPTTFWVSILNTLDNLGKFDGKSDEGFFVGYSLNSKAFRVYNTITKKVEENLHIGFLENKPMIEGKYPKWLFDIDSLTQSMNYVPVTAGTSTNESADASFFDSSSRDDDNDEPKSAADDKKEVEDGYHDDSPGFNTGSIELNTVDSSVNTATSEDMLGVNHSFEATHDQFFNDEDEPEVDL